jgi:hypothetical protein
MQRQLEWFRSQGGYAVADVVDVVVEPGAIQTEFGGIVADKVGKISGSGPYAAQANAVAVSLRSEANAKRNSPPSVIAKVIGNAVTARRPKTRHVASFGARPLLFTRRHTSDRTFDFVISRALGLPRK